MTTPVIDIQNAYRIYESAGDYVYALRDVTLQVARGEMLCIMGPSGSGKSTLVNMLGCLSVPTTGTYKLEGLDVSTLTDRELARLRATRIGFVFQNYNLLPRTTVLRNVELPLTYAKISKRERRERAETALASVGLPPEFYRHNPNELSGGQMQRAAIARALVSNPAVILADEPTGNLDSANSRKVMETLSRIHESGKTIIVVTHDAAVASWASRTVRIFDGKLLADEEELETVARAEGRERA